MASLVMKNGEPWDGFFLSHPIPLILDLDFVSEPCYLTQVTCRQFIGCIKTRAYGR